MPLPIQLSGSANVLVPPPPAAAVGFTKLLRRNLFTSTSGIDLSNTGVDGFDWYIRFAWPNVAANNVGGVGNWAAFAANNPANYSIVGGKIVISAGAVTSNLSLASACYSATDMRGYVGQFLPRSYYAESYMAFQTFGQGNGAFWSMPFKFLNGTAVTNWIELDWNETNSIAGSHGVHQGSTLWTVSTGTSSGGPLYQDSPDPSGSGDMHLWGALVMSPSDNSGTSKYAVYYDNVLQHAPDLGLAFSDTDTWIMYITGNSIVQYCDFWVPP